MTVVREEDGDDRGVLMVRFQLVMATTPIITIRAEGIIFDALSYLAKCNHIGCSGATIHSPPRFRPAVLDSFLFDYLGSHGWASRSAGCVPGTLWGGRRLSALGSWRH